MVEGEEAPKAPICIGCLRPVEMDEWQQHDYCCDACAIIMDQIAFGEIERIKD